MRWGLLGIRVGIILVNLMIVGIIVLSVIPVVSGGLRIDLPQKDLPTPTYENDVVKFSIPVDIYNGGFFDITDFRVRFQVSDGDYLIADQESSPVNIVVGRTSHIDLDMELDLSTVPTSEQKKLVFERTILDVQVGAGAAYSLGLLRADVRTNQTMEWEPLISDLAVNTQGVQVQTNGTGVDIRVPYSFTASDLVTGNHVDLQATLRNSTALLGSAADVIVLQKDNQGELRFTVSQGAAVWLLSHPEDLTIGIDLTFQGASFHQDYSYHWGGMT